MEKIALKIQTLIISEITGSITQDEQDTLNLLRDQYPEIQDLSAHLHQQLKDVSIPKPANRITKPAATTARTAIVHTLPQKNTQKTLKKRTRLAMAAMAAAAAMLFIFRAGNSNTIRFEQDFHINNQKPVSLKLDAKTQHIQGQSLTVNKKGSITTNEGNVFNNTTTAVENVSVSVPAGGLYQLKLSDGTLIVLNSQSTITFPTIFGHKREVTLEGEAYFEIAKDPAKPFIIYTASIATEAIGTSFNVNSYDSAKIVVSLTDGKVKVSGNGEQVDIHPDSAATYANGIFRVSQFDADKLLGWAKGKMYMQSESTQEIEDAAARYLDLKIKFDHPFTGKQARFHIERNKPARAFLEQFTGEYKIDSSNNIYYLK